MCVLGSEFMSPLAYLAKCFYPLSHPSSLTLLGLSPRLPTCKTRSFLLNRSVGLHTKQGGSSGWRWKHNITCGTALELFCDLEKGLFYDLSFLKEVQTPVSGDDGVSDEEHLLAAMIYFKWNDIPTHWNDQSIGRFLCGLHQWPDNK